MEVAKELVKTVSRSFYDDKYSVLLDLLLRERMLPDDVLAERMHVLIKDVNRMAARLREDCLLHMQVRQEQRQYDGRQINRTYYYVDLAHFVDVATYRLYRMRRTLEEQASNQAAERVYHCVTCRRQYGLLDVSRLLNPLTQAFECEVCHSEVQSTDGSVGAGSASSGGSALLVTRLTEQTHEILRMLRRLEGVALPPFDPIEHLKHCEAFELVSEESTNITRHLEGLDEGIASSHDASTTKQRAPEELEVELAAPSTPKDTKAIIHELPSWHTHSTVTGAQVKSAQVPGAVGTRGATGTASTVSASIKASSTSEASLDYQSYYEEHAKRAKADTDHGRHGASEEAATTAVAAPGAGITTASPVEADALSDTTIAVMVQGKAKDIHRITEEDKERMTEEEYVNYYQAYEKL